MTVSARSVSFAALLLSAGTCFGQASPTDDDKALRESRLKLMQQRVATLKAVDPAGEAIEINKHPLLRYSDANRGIVDASLWSLGKDGRPRAILVLELYDDDTLQYEFTGADDLPTSVQGDGWRWSPAKVDAVWTALPDQPPPEESRRDRRRKIPEIASKFSASETWGGRTTPLKLLPQSIDWYYDEKAGILDGAVFALAHGTNAEILVFIEARANEGDTRWVACFARLGAAKLDVSFNERPIWSQPASSGGATQSYFFHSEDY